jgi:DNA-binding SARP family transcriptional activator/pimeloyl-ACP methyl ester carboxylesterase
MLEVRLFGKFEIRLDNQPIEIPSRSAQSLLAYLMLHPDRLYRREKLAGLLWPDSDEANARNNLRQTLWRLRKVIGEDYFVTDRVSVGFNSKADYKLDTDTLQEAVSEISSTDQLIRIVSVYEDRLLPGFYDEWVLLEQERLQALFEDRMQLLLDRLVKEARWREVREWAEWWIARGQTPEPAYRALMMAHAGLGDRAGVATAYQRCVEILNEELGVEPSEETRELYRRLIKEGDHTSSASIEPDSPAPSAVSPQSGHPIPVEGYPTPFVDRAMEQQIRFCTASDEVRIAYATVGHGPALVRAATYLTHLEYDWNSPVWRHWLEGLAEHHTLVRYDQRGCGLSDRDVEEFSLNADVGDLETVVDALDLDRFSLIGLSQSGPVAISYAVRHPERVSHLILYGTYARGFLMNNPTPEQVDEAEMYLKLIELGWGRDNPAFRQVYSTMFLPEGTPEQISWFNDLQRISTSPENAVRRDTASFNLEVTDLARRVTVPTLVIHARNDGSVSFERGRELAALIPNARFVSLESNNHILLANEPAWPRFLAEVHRFLGTESSQAKGG